MVYKARLPRVVPPDGRSFVLLLCLFCHVFHHACEGFTVSRFIGWSSVCLETSSQRKRTSLSSTETEFAPPTMEQHVRRAPRESIYMSALTREALSMVVREEETSESSDDGKESDDESSSKDRGEQVDEDEDDEQLKRRTAAAAAAVVLKRKRGGVRPVKPLKNKSTSVGCRRVGSAARARASQSGVDHILNVVRTVASAASSCTASNNTNTTAKGSESQNNVTSGTKVGGNVIQATISSLLDAQQNSFQRKSDGMSMNVNTFPRTFGILGEEPHPLSHELLKNPIPGTILLYPTTETKEYKRPSRETLSVRVATPDDDVQIANLRLSVFSDFSYELRNQFCVRSCQVLADRRLRGATCLVATCPSGRTSPSDVVVGSVECSVHEFFATKLGRRRPKYSILYITEVAVSPSARRCGVASKLLEGVDELALLRKVESLYLHVDVLNFGALELYRKAGYRKVLHADPMYAEFTTSLNLHDGATKGRRHYLLYKDLVRNPTWLPVNDKYADNRCSLSKVDTATWAFENVLSRSC